MWGETTQWCVLLFGRKEKALPIMSLGHEGVGRQSFNGRLRPEIFGN